MLLFSVLVSTRTPLVSTSDDVGCSRIPPAFWCRNANLSAECGFTEHCERYRKASKNKPVHLTLFYESLCPYCQGFITKHLYPEVYLKYGKYVSIELIPYGNAQRTQSGEIVCEHGPRECVTNRFEGCAIHYLKDPLPFIYCLELGIFDKTVHVTAAGECFKQANVPSAVVQQIL
ncbi:Protein F37H8.5 [Aphelenchoides avenae]|nr:Protein F37H8.5 [Aphelenchus avenae]